MNNKKLDSFDSLYLKNKQEIVFVNGIFIPNISKIDTLPLGIKIKSLTEAIRENDPNLGKHLAKTSINADNKYVNGVFIHIDEHVYLDKPIHIVYTGSEENVAIQYVKNLIIVENKSKLIILEEFYGVNSNEFSMNHITEIITEESSEISHYLLQNENENKYTTEINIYQNKNSKVSSQIISLGSDYTQNNIHSKLMDERASCLFNAVYILNKNQHLNNTTSISHLSQNCASSQLYHGILSEHSKAVFNGKIYVDKNAANTVSSQTNSSLMLSEEAHIDTLPQLEIFNDDVKCSHAALIGQIDENSLYYLKSRGIADNDAQKMLILAFSNKITGKFDSEIIRIKVEKLIIKKMNNILGSGL